MRSCSPQGMTAQERLRCYTLRIGIAEVDSGYYTTPTASDAVKLAKRTARQIEPGGGGGGLPSVFHGSEGGFAINDDERVWNGSFILSRELLAEIHTKVINE